MKLLTSNGTKLAVSVLLLLTACKQAGYQVKQPGSDLIPQPFDGSGSSAPTANIEIYDKGVPVTWTVVGNKVDIKPSLDTLDPDYITKSKCDNPGIIEAAYDLGNGAKPVVTRTECESLAATQQVFTQAGDYLVQMQVKSLDGETSRASMTLRVLEPSTAYDQIEGGFTIHANPILATINQQISFTSLCELKGNLIISWDFADNAKVDGSAVQHAYANPGAYYVNAICKSDTGQILKASLTVVILKDPAPGIPKTALPIPGNNPNLPPKTQPCNATQGPCQAGGAQVPPAPTQQPQFPGQSQQQIVFDPRCGCYVQVQ